MLTLVQRVFWNPFVHEENKKLTDIRPSEFVAAAVLVVLMVWIGVRPNAVLDRIRPSVELLQKAVAAKLASADTRGARP
jgi:NADH:ubiquinone oxidoreductase subunit 4 (subunit M)